MEIKNRRVMVCGMARSGIAAAKLLSQLGARVTISDMKTEEQLGGALEELRALGCAFALGEAPDAHLADQELLVISPGIAWAKPFVQEALRLGVEVIGELEDIDPEEEILFEEEAGEDDVTVEADFEDADGETANADEAAE